MRTSNWYEFRNQTESTADLYLYGEVGGFGANASEFISALSQLKGAHINLHIHSPGGSVFEGHAIFNALRSHPGGVTTFVDGIAASMASVIAMAGKPVKMASNGFLMIHNPWATFSGDATEMRQEADVLDKLKEGLVRIYSEKSGQTADTIRAAMDSETWFDAEEAVAFGFADEIYDGLEAVAKLDVSRFAKAPALLLKLMETPTADAVEPTVETVEAVTVEPVIEQEAVVEAVAPEASVDFASKLTEANAVVDSLRAQLSERDAFVAKLTDDLAKARADAEVTPAKINALATRVVAAAGHPAVEFTTGEPTEAPKQDLVAQYNELRKNGKSAEWLAFLKKHRSALMSAAK